MIGYAVASGSFELQDITCLALLCFALHALQMAQLLTVGLSLPAVKVLLLLPAALGCDMFLVLLCFYCYI